MLKKIHFILFFLSIVFVNRTLATGEDTPPAKKTKLTPTLTSTDVIAVKTIQEIDINALNALQRAATAYILYTINDHALEVARAHAATARTAVTHAPDNDATAQTARDARMATRDALAAKIQAELNLLFYTTSAHKALADRQHAMNAACTYPAQKMVLSLIATLSAARARSARAIATQYAADLAATQKDLTNASIAAAVKAAARSISAHTIADIYNAIAIADASLTASPADSHHQYFGDVQAAAKALQEANALIESATAEARRIATHAQLNQRYH